jgi:hypothetical protein
VTYSELQAAIINYTQNSESTFVGNIPLFVRQAEERIYNSVQIPALRKNVTGTTTQNNRYLSCPIDFLSVFSMSILDQTTNEYHFLLNKDVNFIRSAFPNPADTGRPYCYALYGPTVINDIITTELSFIIGPTPDNGYSVELNYYYYPESIVQGGIKTLGSLVGGTNYTNGIYYDIPLTGGSGVGATANITVSGGVVIDVGLNSTGSFYKTNNVLTATGFGTGTGFSITATDVSNPAGTSWLGDNYDPVLLYGSLVEAYTFMKGEADIMGFYQQKYQEAMSQLNRLGTGLERGDAYRDGQAKIKVNP